MIRVLIVDDSQAIRGLFAELLSSDAEIEVVATASDPFDAREKIKQLNPDVITLDVEMPKMDGISFLEKIMRLRPMPVVMVSSLTQKGAYTTLKALEMGAVDYVPKIDSRTFDVGKMKEMLIAKVKAAARAKVAKRGESRTPDPSAYTDPFKEDALIAIGSSTGGVEALREIVTHFPSHAPPVLITQHMPETFTGVFARRLDTLCAMHVQEARNAQAIERGNIYIAPGNRHLKVGKGTHGFICKLDDGPEVSGHRPSVDVMFESVAQHIGDSAIGAILTGMGRDGAAGMLKMKRAGAATIGQDEASCVVYGMPKAAFMSGAVDKQLPLTMIAGEILRIATY